MTENEEQQDRLKTAEINILAKENRELTTMLELQSAENKIKSQLLAQACDQAVRLRKVLYDIATNWDCDSDSHKHGTPCRACMAKEALEK